MQIEEVLNLVKCLSQQEKCVGDTPLKLGQNYFIRTVTHYYTGKLTKIVGQFLVLEDACWIADTGRFHDFIKDGKCNEYEAFVDDVYIPISSVVDITAWGHKLFKGQK